MADSTDDQVDQESGEPGQRQAVAVSPEVRAETAWRKYIRHTVELCETTCRTPGVDCPKAVELKAAWSRAKDEA
ncbi:hypothetical protein GCM10011583_66030 [Streptomyces camponoticapitis]|uniref:4Fe-4S Wbl-type domain-containing protein n=1 Tax=Streptomyces camponoticapitis TaxID=1616125 RepID=A0ABQ2EU35_9ACTN|nr:hypothetical protein [Streptomyces camponoticapitis]GGK24767.1 hypothetical protein GCM10011583_66030 [Streptomyces camponoticapitis]